MLELNYLRNHTEEAKRRLKKRNRETGIIDTVLALDEDRRKTQVLMDNALAEMNSTSKTIGQLLAQGKKEDAEKAKFKTAELKKTISDLQTQHAALADAVQDVLLGIPNLPQEIVPAGKDAEDNIVVKQGGDVPILGVNALPHWELASKYGIIDFELGNKLTGAGFPVYIGKGAKLQRALIALFLSKGEAAGYTEVMPPLMVNEDSGYGTGQLPDKEGQMYYMPADKYYMIPTAEVPLTNIYRDVVLKEEELPVKLTAYTPCFRREAGSYGKEVKGLNRLHQFDKVEIVHIERPSESAATLDRMVEYVESLVQSLQLPYRILRLCGGDMGFASALTYDFEVYSAAQQRWLEVSSVSNFESFQANRMRCRYKDSKSGKNVLVHTLNGSALALPRILAAILENNQDDRGIQIPKALIPFTGFDRIG